MSELVGKWRNVRDENFSDYMKAFGFGFMVRKLIERLHPDITITADGDKWTIRTQTSISDQTVAFTINEPFETNIKGVTEGKLRCLTSLEDGKLMSDSTPVDADVDADVTANKEEREVIDGQMVHTMTCKGVTCKRYHARLE